MTYVYIRNLKPKMFSDRICKLTGTNLIKYSFPLQHHIPIGCSLLFLCMVHSIFLVLPEDLLIGRVIKHISLCILIHTFWSK